MDATKGIQQGNGNTVSRSGNTVRGGGPQSAATVPNDSVNLGVQQQAAGAQQPQAAAPAPATAPQAAAAGQQPLTPNSLAQQQQPAAVINTPTSLFVEPEAGWMPQASSMTGPNLANLTAPVAAAQTELPTDNADPGARWMIGPKGRLVTTKSAVDVLSKISQAVNLGDADYCKAFGAQPDRSAILLTGGTGVGKTAGIKCLASYTGNPLVRVNLHDNTDELELFGGYKPNPKGPGFVWQDGLVTSAVRNGYWLLLDELNLAEPAVLERLNALLDGDDFVVLTEKSDGEVVRSHPDLRVFATMNPSSYEGRKDLSAAMMDRFKKKIWVDQLPPEEMVQVVKGTDIANGLVGKWSADKTFETTVDKLATTQNALNEALDKGDNAAANKLNAEYQKQLADSGSPTAFESAVQAKSQNLGVKDQMYAAALAMANKVVTGNHDEDPPTKTELAMVNSIPQKMDDKILMSLAMFHSKIAAMCEKREVGKKGGPYPFTLRDMLKLTNRVDMDRKTNPSANPQQLLWRHAVDLYVNRFMSDVDRDRVIDQLGVALFGASSNRPPIMVSGEAKADDQKCVVGDVTLDVNQLDPNDKDNSYIPKLNPNFTWTPSTVDKVAALARSVKLDEPVLIVGPTAAGKTTGIRQLAAMTKTQLRRFNLSMGTDTSQLIGGYYPVERDSSKSYQFKNGVLTDSSTNQPVDGKFELKGGKLIDLNTGQAMFEWKDGILIDAMKKGQWVILDEINLAEPSVLERLNSLLDPDRMVVLTEKDGEKVVADKNFRIFGTMNPATGEYEGRNELSPAMRNRFTERWYPEILDKGELTAIATKMFEGTSKVASMDMGSLMPTKMQPMDANFNKKLAETAVDILLDLRKAADDGQLQTAHKDGYRYTIRSLETFVRFVRTAPEGLVTPDPKNIRKTITYDWKKSIADGVKYTFADGLREPESRKLVEAKGQQYANRF